MPARALTRLTIAAVLSLSALTSGCDKRSGTGEPSPVLSISSVTPTSGSIDGGTSITVRGTGFTEGTTVSFGNQPALATVIHQGLMTVVTRAHPAGIVDVAVTSPGGHTVKLTGGFTYGPPPPSGLPSPVATGLDPDHGSTLGGPSLRVSGSGFVTGTSVIVDGTPLTTYLVEQSLFVTAMPPHAAGTITVTVRNPDGQISSLPDAYTYIDPAALDFEGEWTGGTGPDWQTPVRFTIRDGVVVAALCAGASVLPDSATPAVRSGAFTITGANNAVVMTGRILTNTAAAGQINTALCPNDSWAASKEK